MVIRLAILLLLVSPARAEDSLRLIVPDHRPIVGEMIPLTIRGEYTGAITLETMSFPGSEFYDWIQYVPDRWVDERVDGKSRRVFERRLAVFAKQPGSLNIGPVSHRLTKATPAGREEFTVTAQPVTVPVVAFPTGGRPLVAQHVSITDELSADPEKLGKGDTFIRRVTVSAEGTMAQYLPRRPTFDDSWLTILAAPEIRETRLTTRGPLAVVVWEWHLRLSGDPGTLVPIQIPFFNTVPRKMWSAITLPVDVGTAGTSEATAAPLPATRILGLTTLSGGMMLASGLGLLGRRLAVGGWAALLNRLRRNPHRAALRDAAAKGDLPVLRRVAHAYAAHEHASGRRANQDALDKLDLALFAQQTPAAKFDPQVFADEMLGKGGS